MDARSQTSYSPVSNPPDNPIASTGGGNTITPPSGCQVMRVIGDQDFYLTWAQAGRVKVPAGIPEYFSVNAGENILVQRVTTDGSIDIAWMSN